MGNDGGFSRWGSRGRYEAGGRERLGINEVGETSEVRFCRGGGGSGGSGGG